MSAAASPDTLLSKEQPEPQEEADNLYEEAEAILEEAEAAEPSLEEIARIEIANQPASVQELAAVVEIATPAPVDSATQKGESMDASTTRPLVAATVKPNGASAELTAQANHMPHATIPAAAPKTNAIGAAPPAATPPKANGAAMTPLSPVTPPKPAAVKTVTPAAPAKTLEDLPASKPILPSSELFVWFAGAIAIGATLGAIIVLLILSGINGSLFYTTATRGVQIEREQGRLSEQMSAVSRDIAELQGQMTAINKLPNQVENLNKNMDTAQKTLNGLTQSLESMDRSLKSQGQSLSSLGSDLEKTRTTLQSLNQQMVQVNADMETVRSSAKQFDGFLTGLQNLLGNLTGKK